MYCEKSQEVLLFMNSGTVKIFLTIFEKLNLKKYLIFKIYNFFKNFGKKM